MHNILISADSRFPVSRPKIKSALEAVLHAQKITSPVEVSVLICGTRKSKELAQKYLSDPNPHNVLSFVMQDENEPRTKDVNSYSPVAANGSLVLGDIIICYPIAQTEANRDNMMVDDKINELASHGLAHLLGEHHE